MKSCPTCNRTYPDDTLAFCLVDGSILSAPYDPATTQIYPARRTAETVPSPTTNPIYAPNAESSHPSEKKGGKRGLILVALAALVAVGAVAALWGGWFGGNSSLATQPALDNQNKSATPSTASVATPVNTPESTPTPKPTPSPARKIDLIATWTGTFANRDAILYINSQDGDSFSGILKNSKGAIVAVSGRVNRETGRISIEENRVVEHTTEGPDWVLGSDIGSLSPDGRRMSGSGKDQAGHVYSWSFTRQ